MERRSPADEPGATSTEARVPLDLLLAALGEGVYGVDLDGRATFLNPAGCLLLGYSVGEFLGQRQHDLIHRSPTGAGAPAEECPIYAVLQDGRTRHVDTELFYQKGGRAFPVEYTATAIREGDRVVGAVVVFRNVEERRSAALEAIAARDESLKVAAHDLRGLLHTATLSAHLMDSPELGERQVRALRRIEHATRQMSRLIQELTDSERIIQGEATLELATLEPDALLREAVEAAEPLAETMGVQLVTRGTAALPGVRGDRDLLLRVLANLLRNAIQHSPAGSEITAGAEALASEVLFRVEDAGPGIAEADLPRVFDRFWRATDAPGGGTGLGLSIARGIVVSHGGRIWCTSEPGRGARFCFTLPCGDRRSHDEERGDQRAFRDLAV